MEFKILKQQEINVLTDLFGGKSNPPFTIYNDSFLRNQEKYMLLKRNRKLPESVITSLDFIEILIDFYSPVSVRSYTNQDKSYRNSYGDMIHLHIITNTEIFDDYKKYEGIITEKHTKQYYEEIFHIINQGKSNVNSQEKYKEVLIKVQRFKGFKERFEKYVIPLFGLKTIIDQLYTPHEMDLFALVELIKIKIDKNYNELAAALTEYIPDIDALTLYYISEKKTFPPTRTNNKLRFKDDKKVDIVRFADFFGLSISEINKIFTPAVDSNDRNKVSKEGIFKVLSKYPTLRKNISTQK